MPSYHKQSIIRQPYLSASLHSILLSQPYNEPLSSSTDLLIDIVYTIFKDCSSVLYKKVSMNLLFLINNHSGPSSLSYLVYLLLIHLNNNNSAFLSTNKTIFKEVVTAGKKEDLSPLCCFLLYYALALSSQQQTSKNEFIY